MQTLLEHYNQIFPVLPGTPVKGQCLIEEPENEGKANRVQGIQLMNVNGFQLPHNFAKQSSSFANIAQNHGILKLDCDGIVFHKDNAKKYILLFELKSTFTNEDITHAIQQLLASYLKLIGIFDTVRDFSKSDFEFRLVVAAYPLPAELRNILSKRNDEYSTCQLRLAAEGRHTLKAGSLFPHLNLSDMQFRYLEVPQEKTAISVDISSLFK